MKIIQLKNRKKCIVANVKVDDEDFTSLSKFSWCLNEYGGSSYAMRNIMYRLENGKRKAKRSYMHRLITSAKEGEEVDHINGDKLDNRKENLRVLSKKEHRIIHNKFRPRFKGMFCATNKQKV